MMFTVNSNFTGNPFMLFNIMLFEAISFQLFTEVCQSDQQKNSDCRKMYPIPFKKSLYCHSIIR